MDIKLKEKRKEVLLKIDRLKNKCNCFFVEEQRKCNNCKAIQELGKQLLKLVDKRAFIDKNNRKKYVEFTEDTKGTKDFSNPFLEGFPFTKLDYLNMRNKQKMTDEEIILQMNIDQEELNEFKEVTHMKEVNGVVTSENIRLNATDGKRGFVDTFPITKRKYLQMKNEQQMIDNDIIKLIGVSNRRITTWKELVGILNEYRATNKSDAFPITVSEYLDMKNNQNMSDVKIIEKTGVSLRRLNQWKKENGLSGQIRVYSNGYNEKRLEDAAKRRKQKMKEYYEIKEKNPNLGDGKIAKQLGISYNALYKWKKQIEKELQK